MLFNWFPVLANPWIAASFIAALIVAVSALSLLASPRTEGAAGGGWTMRELSRARSRARAPDTPFGAVLAKGRRLRSVILGAIATLTALSMLAYAQISRGSLEDRLERQFTRDIDALTRRLEATQLELEQAEERADTAEEEKREAEIAQRQAQSEAENAASDARVDMVELRQELEAREREMDELEEENEELKQRLEELCDRTDEC
jgi:multidrug efflux pump subunit AcrB